MSAPVSVLKHAIAGSVIGETTAMIATSITEAAIAQYSHARSAPPGSVMRGVIGGTITALCILAGDRVLDTVMSDNDLLYHLFFYNVVFTRSPAYGFANALRDAVMQASKGRYAPGPMLSPHSHTPGQKCDDCTKTGKSCGGCSGH
jgi:hypothetical protein